MEILATAINPEALSRSLSNVSCGGFVSFEGWIRDHNEGRAVHALEYEVYTPIAVKEGNKIIAEAHERFDILEAACQHREGLLALGDCAVWVGVAAAHRGAAFDACRYIIDNVKTRLPIWKKEHYVEGESGWVSCEHCAAAGHQHD